MSAWAHSRVGRWAAGSVLIGFWSGPEPSWQPCAHSRLLRGLRMSRLGWCGFLAGALIAAVLVPSVRVPLLVIGAAVAVSAAAPTTALALVPALLLWGPRIHLFGMGDEAVFLRLEQPVLLGLLLRLASERGSRDSALFASLALWTAAVAASVAAGIWRGTLPSAEVALLYLAQFLELALVFVVACAYGPRLGVWGVYAWVLPVVALAAYGIAEYLNPMFTTDLNVYRTFERGLFQREANHYAGVFACAAPLGLALAREPRWRTLGLTLAALSATAMVGTRSREGAVALAVGLAMLFVLRFPRLWLLPIAACAALLLAVPVETWHEWTGPRSSMHARFELWNRALGTVCDFPLLGLGAGARHRSQYDNFYVMLLAETGLMGLAAFGWWLASLARELLRSARRPGLSGAVAAGALAALAGVATQGLAAVAFAITALAGPLLWLSGWALSLDETRR